jgi:hypothetical protein
VFVHGRVFSSHTSGLKTELSCKVLESLFVLSLLGDVGELTENGLSLSCSHVGGASSDDSVCGVFSELKTSTFDFTEELVEGCIDCSEISSLDDGNDSELIFFTDPDHLCLVFADPNTSSVWPVRGDS